MLHVYVRAQLAKSTLRQWLAAEEGATAVEYGLIAAGIAMAIIIAIFAIGDNLSFFFNTIQSQLATRSGNL